MIRVLHDDEFRALQAIDHALAIRHGGDGIGANDPDCLDFAGFQFLKKRNGIVEIFDQIANEKTIDFLQQYAKIEDVPPSAPKPA